jgi:hypothetical protein
LFVAPQTGGVFEYLSKGGGGAFKQFTKKQNFCFTKQDYAHFFVSQNDIMVIFVTQNKTKQKS